MQASLSAPNFCYRWGGPGDNPYRGLLALADAFVVTGESMSMLGEAAAMDRPLFIFDVGDGDTAWWRLSHNFRYKPLSYHFAMRFGPRRMRRDVGKIQSALVDSHRAVWLEQGSIGGAVQDLHDHPGSSSAPGRGVLPGAEQELQRAEVRRNQCQRLVIFLIR